MALSGTQECVERIESSPPSSSSSSWLGCVASKLLGVSWNVSSTADSRDERSRLQRESPQPQEEVPTIPATLRMESIKTSTKEFYLTAIRRLERALETKKLETRRKEEQSAKPKDVLQKCVAGLSSEVRFEPMLGGTSHNMSPMINERDNLTTMRARPPHEDDVPPARLEDILQTEQLSSPIVKEMNLPNEGKKQAHLQIGAELSPPSAPNEPVPSKSEKFVPEISSSVDTSSVLSAATSDDVVHPDNGQHQEMKDWSHIAEIDFVRNNIPLSKCSHIPMSSSPLIHRSPKLGETPSSLLHYRHGSEPPDESECIPSRSSTSGEEEEEQGKGWSDDASEVVSSLDLASVDRLCPGLTLDRDTFPGELSQCGAPTATDIERPIVAHPSSPEVYPAYSSSSSSVESLLSDQKHLTLEREIELERCCDLNGAVNSECSSPTATSEDNMNYFRNKFHKNSYLNADAVIRDVRKRRSIYDESDPFKSPLASSFLSASSTSASKISVNRTETANDSDVKSLKSQLKTRDHGRDDSLQREESTRTPNKSRDATNLPPNLAQKEAQQLDQTSSGAVTLSKSASLRRRRWPSDEKSRDSENPSKKGNYDDDRQEARSEEDIVAKLDEPTQAQEDGDPNVSGDVDPLSFIEIKSAAQWKAMSKRISWKFNESASKEEARVAEQPPGFTISTESTKGLSVEPPGEFIPTKVQQLRLVCWRVKPWNQPKKNPKLFTSQFAAPWGADCDEVFPGLFIGDKKAASNVRFLQKIGVTHVLNAAEGKDEGLVDLSQAHYAGTDITYLGFPLWDTSMCNVIPYLGCASEFIASAIKGGGKCLVNCQMGVSRSSTCAMAYLLIDQGMKAIDVLTQFRQHRDIRPNDGFLDQIVELDNDLRKFRELGIPCSIKLSTLADLAHLPQDWHYEFWTTPVTEEEIGHPLVHLGEPYPTQNPSRSSKVSSKSVSKRSSGKVSKRSSFRSSRASPKTTSRSASFRSGRSSRARSVAKGTQEGGNPEEEELDDGGEWEWVWEDGEDDDDENVPPTEPLPIQDKLLKVKAIIEKPEERWRVMWQNPRTCDTPSSVCSNHSMRSNLSTRSANVVQPGLDEQDPLSIVRVSSAKQWKAMSKNLTIDLQGIDLSDNGSDVVGDGVVSQDSASFTPTTAQQLRLLCWRVKPWEQPKARNLFSSIFARGWGVDCDEVHPSLFIGDEATARNIKFLQRMKITHVLNAAEGIWTDHSFVDLTAKYYEGSGITYQGLQMWDSTHVKILPFLGCADEFIASALSNGGKCLVNCQMGVSRSCVAAMAYMMLSQGWGAMDVLREFRKRRDVRPNDYFLDQMVQFDNELRRERLFKLPRSTRFHSLKDLGKIPKPWHYEFWDSLPALDSLPFQLSHFGEPRPDMHRKRSTSVTTEPLTGLQPPALRTPLQTPSLSLEPAMAIQSPPKQLIPLLSDEESSESSDWEWEDEDEEEELPDKTCDTRSQMKTNIQAKEPEVFIRTVEKKSKPTEPKAIPASDSRPTRRSSSEFVPTTDKQLRLICWRVKPWNAGRTSKLFSSQFAVAWKVDCDEVFPNLFIGDAAAATNVKFLKHLNVTHVLNTAQGDDEGLVNLDHDHFHKTGIDYKGFLMWDSAWFDVTPFLDEAVEFIADALESGGKCLVNCQMGVSRSSTCALAYMMKKKEWTVGEALKQFRAHRDVRPNDGFMRILATLDNNLRKKREGFE